MTVNLPEHLVVDASVVVAMLVDVGRAGHWATAQASGARLAAPDLMPYEAGNILRRHLLAGLLDSSAATLAHGDLTTLPVDLYPYAALAERAWELRGNLTIYDGAYAALAELLEAPLLTLDTRLSGATGPRCPILAFDPAG
ncbi:MAG: type II toxin-antitoxin system VapC family toxin [Chloroflexota bacterium]|nr:type II toxin-antitoxin system VapC family toxin [Chloroflexota bacterium]